MTHVELVAVQREFYLDETHFYSLSLNTQKMTTWQPIYMACLGLLYELYSTNSTGEAAPLLMQWNSYETSTETSFRWLGARD